MKLWTPHQYTTDKCPATNESPRPYTPTHQHIMLQGFVKCGGKYYPVRKPTVWTNIVTQAASVKKIDKNALIETALVDKQTYDLLRSPKFAMLTTLIIRCNFGPINLSHLTQLTRLEVQGTPYRTFFKTLPPSLRKLKFEDIFGVSIDRHNMETLTGLTDLELHTNGNVDYKLPPNLVSVELRLYGDESYQQIYDAIRQLTCLKTLVIIGYHWIKINYRVVSKIEHVEIYTNMGGAVTYHFGIVKELAGNRPLFAPPPKNCSTQIKMRITGESFADTSALGITYEYDEYDNPYAVIPKNVDRLSFHGGTDELDIRVITPLVELFIPDRLTFAEDALEVSNETLQLLTYHTLSPYVTACVNLVKLCILGYCDPFLETVSIQDITVLRSLKLLTINKKIIEDIEYVSSLAPTLESLSFMESDIIGRIPDDICKLTNLTGLHVSASVEIPNNIGYMPSLCKIGLCFDDDDDNENIINLPYSLCRLTKQIKIRNPISDWPQINAHVHLLPRIIIDEDPIDMAQYGYSRKLAVEVAKNGPCKAGICYCNDHFPTRHATPDSYLGVIPRDIVWLVCQFLQHPDHRIGYDETLCKAT